MAKERDPLMFEMKEEEVVEAADQLEAALLAEEAALCQASCLSDPQVGLKIKVKRYPYSISRWPPLLRVLRLSWLGTVEAAPPLF